MDGITVIIGIGNERRRDDAVGIAIVRELLTRNLPPEVRIEEAGTVGFDLTTALEGVERAIITAAVGLGATPGTVHVLSPADAEARADYISPLGTMTLIDALELATLVGATPRTLIVGIEPAEIVPGQTLSRTVQQAVGHAAEIVLKVATSDELWPSPRR